MMNADPGTPISPGVFRASKKARRFLDSQDAPSLVPNVAQIFRRTSNIASTAQEGAALLLSVADIVSKEIISENVDWDDDLLPPPLSLSETENIHVRASGSFGASDIGSRTLATFHRIRTVSAEFSDESVASSSSRGGSPEFGFSTISRLLPAIVSPFSSPVSRERPAKRVRVNLKHLGVSKRSGMPTKKAVQARGTLNGHPLKTILRKKFSWKNYPELEAFLVANREEYLRHSALNYTVQQKQFNNKLTERLLELAADYGYVFDQEAFSFVTVRDRIRCYYKSFVQSAKKRGVIIGYAARKAGILTEEDLEQSACQKGKIVLPTS